ncbi:hypothetical protein IM792_16960 [Mucilaginibacter sp. JRF]|uniref:hypothetical protein n=1 Tax=Mucilaginibacter sp. JRF TaxID=2780088 RepID=UPI00187E10A8|nr:hypothetical protein [Mucilaginibacter sp. JRF]MBE9586147.1 hypothetical protein [Mucilaginibacter sp. JRF]
MSSRSARPVKDEKGFFGKVKDTIDDILSGPQGDLVSKTSPEQEKKEAKNSVAKKRSTSKTVIPSAKTTVKRKVTKATPEAKTLQGKAEKQVIAAKAIAVSHTNIEPVKTRKQGK